MTLTFQFPSGETLSADLPDEGDFTVGSAPGNDIVLDHPSLHPEHATFHSHEGTVRLEDTSEETTFTRTLQIGTQVYLGEILVTAGAPKTHAPIAVPTSRDDDKKLQQQLDSHARKELVRTVRNTILTLVVLMAIAYAAGFTFRYLQG